MFLNNKKNIGKFSHYFKRDITSSLTAFDNILALIILTCCVIILFSTYQYYNNNLSISYFSINIVFIFFILSILLVGFKSYKTKNDLIEFLKSDCKTKMELPELHKITIKDFLKNYWPFISNFINVIIMAFLILITTFIIVFIFISMFSDTLSLTLNGDDFSNILEIILAFIGIVGLGIYSWISRSIQNEVKQTIEIEQKITKAKSNISDAFLMYTLFNLEIFKKKGNQNKDFINEFMERSLYCCKKALITLDGLPKLYSDLNSNNFSHLDYNLQMKAYRVAFHAKNTRAYMLAWKQRIRNNENNSTEINTSLKNKVLEITKEMQSIINRGEIYKFTEDSPSYVFEETIAWAYYCFDEKEKSEKIIRDLIGRSPFEWIEKNIKNQYTDFISYPWYVKEKNK